MLMAKRSIESGSNVRMETPAAALDWVSLELLRKILQKSGTMQAQKQVKVDAEAAVCIEVRPAVCSSVPYRQTQKQLSYSEKQATRKEQQQQKQPWMPSKHKSLWLPSPAAEAE